MAVTYVALYNGVRMATSDTWRGIKDEMLISYQGILARVPKVAQQRITEKALAMSDLPEPKSARGDAVLWAEGNWGDTIRAICRTDDVQSCGIGTGDLAYVTVSNDYAERRNVKCRITGIKYDRVTVQITATGDRKYAKGDVITVFASRIQRRK